MLKPALLILDMQKELVYYEKRKKALSILPNMKKLVEFAHKRRVPIFYTKITLDPDDDQFDRFKEIYCVKNTVGCEIIDELKPLKGRVIEKQKHSAFFRTELDDMLKKQGVDTVILTGLQTQICIMTTAADASFRGYRVLVVGDCVFSTRKSKKEWALKWIQEYVGAIASTKEILRMLRC